MIYARRNLHDKVFRDLRTVRVTADVSHCLYSMRKHLLLFGGSGHTSDRICPLSSLRSPVFLINSHPSRLLLPNRSCLSTSSRWPTFSQSYSRFLPSSFEILYSLAVEYSSNSLVSGLVRFLSNSLSGPPIHQTVSCTEPVLN